MSAWNAWYIVFAIALGGAFVLSAILTHLMRGLSIRWDMLDHPGDRKLQSEPMPLLGGVAIWVTFTGVVLGGLFLVLPVRQLGLDWFEDHVVHFLGARGDIWWKLAGLTLGSCIIFGLGLVDDIKTLRPEAKLAGQVASALVVVLSGLHIDFLNVHVVVSSLATMVWIVMMVNAMNFLDNMDGLCAGISGIAALALFACLLPSGQTFVCVLLLVFAGAVFGFLYHNFVPARIFMGDAGAMFCGYFLATVALLATFYSTDQAATRVAMVAPLLALAVPVFDITSVVFIRWRRGESIMKGDKRHFSHRLVKMGMTQRQAVEFIYCVTAVTGLGAVLLPQLDPLGTVIILAMTGGIFGLIAILMSVNTNGSPLRGEETQKETGEDR